MNSWLNVKEAASFLKCSKSTIYRLCRSRALSFTKKGIGLRIRIQDLEAWLDKGKREARTADFLLTAPLKVDSYGPGGNTEMPKGKSKTRGRYGFDHVYLRTYESGKSRWTIDFRDENNRRIQKALPHAQSGEEAVFALQKKVQEVFDRKHGIERRRREIGFTDFSEIYLQDYAMIAKKSWETDAYRLKILKQFFADKKLREISPLMIQKFRAWRLREGNSKSTTNRHLQLLKKMFNVAIEEAYAEENPVKRVKLYSERDVLREKVLTEEEQRNLLESSAEHLRSILILALNTGMRRGEILNLMWNQVDFKNRTIRVEKTKSGRVRFIPMNDAVFNELCISFSIQQQGNLMWT